MKAESVPSPLVLDATAQTDRIIQKTESCQTKKSQSIDFEVQTEFKTDTKTTSTQTIKQENQEIAMPNRPTSSESKQSKKRKLDSEKSPSIASSSGSDTTLDDLYHMVLYHTIIVLRYALNYFRS